MNVPTAVRVCPIVREPDGLAMSSRNAYLTPDERQRAVVLSQSLNRAESLVARGERSVAVLIEQMRDQIASVAPTRIDYVALVDAESLEPVDRDPRPHCRAAGRRDRRHAVDRQLHPPTAFRLANLSPSDVSHRLLHSRADRRIPLVRRGRPLALWIVFSVLLLAWLVRRQGFNADTWGHVPLLALIAVVIWIVLPHIAEPGRGLAIRGYGSMLLVGILAATTLTVYRARRVGIHPDLIFSLAFWGILPGLIGARLFYVIEYWEAFRQPTFGATLIEVINFTKGGLVVYGALIGALPGFAVFCIKEKLPLLSVFDVLVPGMLLGLALGRLGCFLNGCCFGGACELPWAVQFPLGSPPYLHQVEQGEIFVYGIKIVGSPDAPPVLTDVEPGSPAARQGLKPGQRVRTINDLVVANVAQAQLALLEVHRMDHEIVVQTEGGIRRQWALPSASPRSAPVHPTQIYQSIDAFVLLLFLLAYDPFRRRDGELLAMALLLYPINRFIMEAIRIDEPGIWGTGLSIGQIVSLAILMIAVVLWGYLLRQPPTRTLAPCQGAA